VSGLFTGAWIAKAITLGEHLLWEVLVKSFGYKNGRPWGRPFLLEDLKLLPQALSDHIHQIATVLQRDGQPA
jgi:hypothetical protein